MTYMVNTRKSGDTGESRGQVARRLLQCARRAQAMIIMQEEVEKVSTRQVIGLVGVELQDLLIEKNLLYLKDWEEIIRELEKHALEEEEHDRIELERAKGVEEMLIMMKESIREEVRGEIARGRAVVGKRFVRDERFIPRSCFVCGKEGHIARVCSLRKGKPEKENRDNFNKEVDYSCVSCTKEEEIEESTTIKRGKTGLELEVVINRFPEVLKPTDEIIQYKTGVKCYIRTPKGERVVRKGQIVPQSLKEKTKLYFKGLLDRGIIRKSKSTWRNPIRALEKPNGDVRVVSNLMGLNDLVEKDPYMLPTIREIIQSTQGSTHFSIIDLKEGFYCIEIEESHKHKTAFEFDGAVYEWNSMVMGFKNAPQVMQRTMNGILEDLRGSGVEVYMDDIVIHAKSGKRHDELFLEVMKRFGETGLKVNPSKIQYRKDEVELLGVTIDGYNRKPSEITKNEALEYKRPECVKDVRRFLGLAGWFRDFIKNFALITVALTESLKTQKKWKWSDEMEEEFNLVKEELRNMRPLKIPDYNKGFRLRTDACDTGLGAVLLQVDRQGQWVPIQWASKKLTPTERRYTITEKEMLAVVWAVEKFSYELRGRKFELMTDHKALEEIRKKPYFNNNRINRWIERIQEFDFTVQYVKGELMTDADALSRQYQSEKVEKEEKELSVQMVGKIEKHKRTIEGVDYWEFDNGKRAIIPRIEERRDLILTIHKDLNHRGVKGTHYQLKQKYYWPGMKDQVTKSLKSCETCQIGNRKSKGGVEFVTSSYKGEKMAIDIMEVGEPKRCVLVGIDYFTRFLYAKVLEDKSTKNIVKALEEWFSEELIPEEIISDNAKEFESTEFKEWCSINEVRHRKVSIESHSSNGRVERVIRTLRESLFKGGNQEIEKGIIEAVIGYNKTYHSGIKCTPEEASNEADYNIDLKWENSSDGDYQRNFIKRAREVFKKGQKVRVAKRENLGNVSKRDCGRFTRMGVVIEICGNDSYLIRDENDRIIKKRHYDLKGVLLDETNRLEEGMLGF